MAEEGDRRNIQDDSGADPGTIMEEVLEKLKLLDYENKLCRVKGLRPFNKAYFAYPSNHAAEQFIQFTQLVSWLFQLCKHQVHGWDKYADPSTASTNIMLELKKLGIEIDFPPAKLKQGNGEGVCMVLLALCNKALKAQKFSFRPPHFKKDEGDVETALEDSGDEEGAANESMEDNAIESEGEEENYADMVGNKIQEEHGESHAQHAIESNIDPIEWNLECERVAPRLKYAIASDSKEWRNHLEQTKKYKKSIEDSLPETKAKLGKMGEEIQKALERIAKKEQNINRNFDNIAGDYRSKQTHLNQVSEKYNKLSESVTEMSSRLSEINERLEKIQETMNEQGNTMTDTSPLIRIKKALQNVRTEIKQMDLRIGVLSQTLLQSKLREKTSKDQRQRNNELDVINEYDIEA
eukprot:CAMPEP_0114992064 /NCGR_PEP_ID=MMETSP0216-20121206/11731_1 /TAXON_ID=223996 /ORGANISM="Protocruzia adherens, Strain Boccale" /LENGTH=408 /DNA_ID=CAMNT_0002355483 /DNA_START=81 /DNA_END=1307 /DNA_ORIENTATION=+